MTKKQRHATYKELLEAVCDDPEVTGGLCYFIAECTKYGESRGQWFFILSDEGIMKELPELWSMKPEPKNSIGYWYPQTAAGWEKRIALIEQCIELTK